MNAVIKPPARSNYPWPQLDVDIASILAEHKHAQIAEVGYGISQENPMLYKANSWRDTPGVDWKKIDCSGYFGFLIAVGTKGACEDFLQRGSVEQREIIEKIGFKKSNVASAGIEDGYLRVAFLPPGQRRAVGHVSLILNGSTIESYGGYGPGSRKWTGNGWQSEALVFVLRKR